MQNFPLISVIMSAYNAENHVSEAIESILNQTFTQFEFIIVNESEYDVSINFYLQVSSMFVFQKNFLSFRKNFWSLKKNCGL